MLDLRKSALVLAILAALLVFAGSHGPDIVVAVASWDVVQVLADVQP